MVKTRRIPKDDLELWMKSCAPPTTQLASARTLRIAVRPDARSGGRGARRSASPFVFFRSPGRAQWDTPFKRASSAIRTLGSMTVSWTTTRRLDFWCAHAQTCLDTGGFSFRGLRYVRGARGEQALMRVRVRVQQMSGQKKGKSKTGSNYHIAKDKADMARASKDFMGKLR